MKHLWEHLLICLVCFSFVFAQDSNGEPSSSVQQFELSNGSVGSIDWGAEGLVQVREVGFPPSNVVFEAQKRTLACRAAIVNGQRRLLEIIEGVSLFGDTSINDNDASLVADTVRSEVNNVLVGAIEAPDSRVWNAEESFCELTMVVPLDNVREAIPLLGVAADGKLVIVDSVKQRPIEEIVAEILANSDTASTINSEVNATTIDEVDATEDVTEVAPVEQVTEAVALPVATDDLFTVDAGGTLEGSVLLNDLNLSGTAQITLVGNVSQGVLTLNSDGSFSYQAGVTGGTDVFKYALVTDAGTAEAFAQITINPVAVSASGQATTDSNSSSVQTVESPSNPNNGNQPPIATDDNVTVFSGGTIEFDIFLNDLDPEDKTLQVFNHSTPAHGLIEVQADGKITYTSRNDGATEDSFTYFANDGELDSNLATVRIKIIPSDPTVVNPQPPTPTADNSSPETTQADTESTGDGTGVGGQPPTQRDTTPTEIPQPAIITELPSSIIFDASALSTERALQMNIEATSKVLLAQVKKPSYHGSVDEILGLDASGSSPQIINVFGLDPTGKNLILDDEAALVFLSLLAEKDFIAESKIFVARGN